MFPIFMIKVKMRVRYAESKQVKEMREHFEKAEKIALRSSKTYKVKIKINHTKFTQIKLLSRGIRLDYFKIYNSSVDSCQI